MGFGSPTLVMIILLLRHWLIVECLRLLAIKLGKEKNLVSFLIFFAMQKPLWVHYLINHCIYFLQEIFEVSREDGTVLAMKLHRLGRTSFRAVANQRDYLGHRTSYNWLYLSRLAATKEFAFMKVFHCCYVAICVLYLLNWMIVMSVDVGFTLVFCSIRPWKNTVFLFQMPWTIIGIAWLCHLSKVTLCKCF